MSAPRRWKESPDAPVGMRELLSAARPPRDMPERSFERGARNVSKLGAAPAAVAVLSIWSKLAAAGIVTVAAVGTATIAYERSPRTHEWTTNAGSAPGANGLEAPPAPAQRDVPPPPPPREADDDHSSEVPPVTPPSAPPTRARISNTTPPTPSATIERAKPAVLPPDMLAPAPTDSSATTPRAETTLAAELAMLEDARTWLARDPDAALVRLEAHRRRHPHGVLASERDLMELDALRRAGRREEARERASAWLARDPSGLHAARVRAILASLEP